MLFVEAFEFLPSPTFSGRSPELSLLLQRRRPFLTYEPLARMNPPPIKVKRPRGILDDPL